MRAIWDAAKFQAVPDCGLATDIKLAHRHQSMWKSAGLIILVFQLAAGVAHAGVKGPARVVDGDTLKIGEITYRLHGIDAPEAGQKCNRPGAGKWRCGKEATKALKAFIADKVVNCDNRGEDGYGRTLAVCTADGLDLNGQLVRQGLAWAFRSYSTDYM